MIIIGLTDIHGDIACIDAIAAPLSQADMVLVAGDLTHFGHLDAGRRVVEALRRHNESILAVAGNCDYEEVGTYLAEETISIDRRHVNIDHLEFVGIGGSLPCPGRTPYEAAEEEFEAHLSTLGAGLPATPRIFVSHQPPYDSRCDVLINGIHVGSSSVRRFIETYTPLLCLTGHIHESANIDTIGATSVINPGPLWTGRYAYAEISDDGKEVKTLEIRHFV